MQSPFLKLHIDEENQLCISSVRPGQEDHSLGIQLPVTSASGVLGSAILSHLQILRPDAFLEAGPVDPADVEVQDSGVGHLLLRKSIKEKTSFYVDVMERIFSEAAASGDDGASFYRDSWPTIREHVKSFPNR